MRTFLLKCSPGGSSWAVSRNQRDGSLINTLWCRTDQQQEMAAMQHKGRKSQQQQGLARRKAGLYYQKRYDVLKRCTLPSNC
ncbi:hypothetical protein FRX31_020421, partial [Thalictrum thalictroides]